MTPIAFAGSPLDRADNIRADADALGGLMTWKARLLLLDGMMPDLDDAGRLASVSYTHLTLPTKRVVLIIERTES